MPSVMQQENRAGATMTPALNQRPWSTSRRFTPIRRWAGGLIRMVPAFGVQRSSVVPEFPAGPLQGTVCRSRSGIPGRLPATGERCPSQDGPSAKPAPLLTHCLLTRPIPASACGHDQVPQVDRAVRFRSCRVRSWAGPCAFPLQFRVHSAAGAAGPAAGKPHGGEDHPGVPPQALSVLIACRLSISAPPGARLGFSRERPPTPGTRGRHAISTWGNRAGR